MPIQPKLSFARSLDKQLAEIPRDSYIIDYRGRFLGRARRHGTHYADRFDFERSYRVGDEFVFFLNKDTNEWDNTYYFSSIRIVPAKRGATYPADPQTAGQKILW